MHHSINRSFDFFSGRFYSELTLGSQTPAPHSGPSSSKSKATSAGATSSEATKTLLKPCRAVDQLAEDDAFVDCETSSDNFDERSPHRSLAALLPQTRFFAGSDIRFHSIAESAAVCTPGQLVVYRIGVDCPDELISQALARGAAGILTEQILPVPLPQCICSDTDRALAEMTAKELIDENGSRPDQRLLTIGIVGESGKSTTALCLATILRDIPCRVSYETDLGSSDGVTTELSDEKTTAGAELLNRLSEAADAGAAVSILELDDALLQCGGYDQIEFDVLLISGRNASRRDFGPSPIECALERVALDGIVVVSVDDKQSLRLAKDSGYVFMTYGVNAEADVSLHTFSSDDGVLTGMIRHEMNSAILESFLGNGLFAHSIVAAAAVGVATENPLVQIAESVSKLRNVPGRCETIIADEWDQTTAGPTMILDAAGTPQRVQRMLTTIRQRINDALPVSLPLSKTGNSAPSRRAKLWCVLAVSVHDDSDTLARYGRLLETLPDHCVLTCAPDSKDRFLALSHEVLDGVQDIATMRLVADQDRAISWANQCAAPGDTVMVLGGMDRTCPRSQREHIQHLQQLIKQLQSRSASSAKRPQSVTAPLKIYNPEC